MQKWEYLYVLVIDLYVSSVTNSKLGGKYKKSSWATFLREIGEDGWEMVGFEVKHFERQVMFHTVFKRPKE